MGVLWAEEVLCCTAGGAVMVVWETCWLVGFCRCCMYFDSLLVMVGPL